MEADLPEHELIRRSSGRAAAEARERHGAESVLPYNDGGSNGILIHPDDSNPRSLADGDTVRVFNDLGAVECEVTVTPEVRPGTVVLLGRH